jgi:branched-subunit amino acid ABC-type transport system permease component
VALGDLTLAILLTQLLHGLMWGLLLILIASGLALIFGMMGVINFAHGSLYMLGAYVALSVISTTGNFWLALLVSPILVALVGAAMQYFGVRPLQGRPPIYQLLLTFGMALAFDDVVKIVWGLDNRSISTPQLLAGSVDILGSQYPIYRLFIIGFSALVALTIMVFLERTKLGMIIRAGAHDAEMVSGLGINIFAIFVFVFALGAALAATAGVIAAPLLSAYPGMGISVIIDAFIVLIVGGLGSFRGSIIGGLVMGQVQTLGNFFLPDLAMVVPFAIMAVVLIIWPKGLAAQEGI